MCEKNSPPVGILSSLRQRAFGFRNGPRLSVIGERHGNRYCCRGVWGLHSGTNTPEWEPQTGEDVSARMAKDAFATQKLNLSPDRNKESPSKAKAEGVAAPVRKFPTSSLGSRVAMPDGSALRLARPCLIIGFASCH